MNIYIIMLIWSQQFQNRFAFANCIENTQFIQQVEAKIRGNYLDVASEKNGAIISTARTINFYYPDSLASPLRDRIYFYTDSDYYVGHVYFVLYLSLIIELTQPYEINLVRFRIWDWDNRIADLQIFIIGSDRITETQIYNGFAQSIKEVRFPDQLVTKIKFYNKNGTSFTGHKLLSFIKVQAFYQL
ncbi:unnamed protein product (macronuclear) [Paramecium tetraurelia]|uniref:Malectin domain-containing protein n=1 Tax=Paramecium tetraurelia TaxID=5888 RepID=A0CSJ0_PARTE|nr:uncharacterized protein GSPATT00010029001 [Paramecium tetraurelia]CAK73757.1 unnamed protein product [Paramecium tetraurelia]|eukprot:XP_001441154.1 hypothetical protein (macronuclear) [Paramecium tetraurelia strain d4-2]